MINIVSKMGLLLVLILGGCSSAQKVRREERDKVAQSKGVYCDFVSESDFKDVDIELNLRMAKRCNVSRPFSISGYKRVNENPGVMYCCNSEGVNDTADTAPVKASSNTPAGASKQGE